MNLQTINERMSTVEAEVKGLKQSRDEARIDIKELQKTVWKATGTLILVNGVLAAIISKVVSSGLKPL